MKVDIVNNSAIEKTLNFVLEADQVEKEFGHVLNLARKQTIIKGYRPGKAPDNVLKNHLGQQGKAKVADALIQSALGDAVRDFNLALAGNPIIKKEFASNKEKPFIGQFNKDGTFTFAVDAEVAPELKDIVLDNLIVSSKLPSIEEIVETKLQEVREQNGILVPVERASKTGDTVSVSFVASAEGKEVEKLSADFHSIIVDKDELMLGFSANFADRKAEDEFSFDFKLPDNFFNPEFAGKTAMFKCHCYSVSETQLPELNDEFTERVLFNTLAAARADLTEKAKLTELKSHQARQTEEITDALIANNPFDVPKVWINSEAMMLAQRFGIKDVSTEQAVEINRMAERSVRRSFIFDKIYVQEQSIHFTPEEIREILKTEGAQNNMEPEEFLTSLKNSGRYESFMAYHQQLKVVDFLLARTIVSGEVK